MAIDIYKPQKNDADVAIKINLPIGSIYENKFNINVENYFYGTWSRWGNGEVLVGVNEGDIDFGTPDKALGAKTHTLTVAEMPSHAHSMNGASGAGTWRNMFTAGNNAGVETMAVWSTGGGGAHNNIQPSRTIYRWIRVA